MVWVTDLKAPAYLRCHSLWLDAVLWSAVVICGALFICFLGAILQLRCAVLLSYDMLRCHSILGSAALCFRWCDALCSVCGCSCSCHCLCSVATAVAIVAAALCDDDDDDDDGDDDDDDDGDVGDNDGSEASALAEQPVACF